MKDKNAPKRPQSAYFLWMNENRESIKEKHPGLSVGEVAKKSGELWRELKDKKVRFFIFVKLPPLCENSRKVVSFKLNFLITRNGRIKRKWLNKTTRTQ